MLRIIIEIEDDDSIRTYLDWSSREQKLEGKKIVQLSASDSGMFTRSVDLKYKRIITDY